MPEDETPYIADLAEVLKDAVVAPVVRGQLLPVFAVGPARVWNVDPQKASVYAFKALESGAYSSNDIEVIFAGEHVGLVHFKQQLKQVNDGVEVTPCFILEYDLAHNKTANVFSGRWAEPQVQRVIRVSQLKDYNMLEVVEDEFQTAALSSMTIQQAQVRIGEFATALETLPSLKGAKLSLGVATVRQNSRGHSRINAPLIIRLGPVMVRARIDAVRGLILEGVDFPPKIAPEPVLAFLSQVVVGKSWNK